MSSTKIFLSALLVTCIAIGIHLFQYVPFTSSLPIVVGMVRFAAALGAFIGMYLLLTLIRLVTKSKNTSLSAVTVSSIIMAVVAIAMTLASLGNRVSDGLLQLYAM